MATRHIWEAYDIKETQIDTIDKVGPITKTQTATSGMLGDDQNPLLLSRASDNGESTNLVILCLPNDMTDFDLAVEVRPRVYYKLEEPSSGEITATYETHPYVIVRQLAGFDSISAVELTEVKTNTNGNENISISYTYIGPTTKTVTSKGDNFKYYVTSKNRNTYPDDGLFTSDTRIWCVYLKSDSIDFQPNQVTFNPGGIPATGGTITARINPTESSIGGLITRNWLYTVDNGDTWVSYTNNSTLFQYMFNVDGNSTGFGIAIQTMDDHGYIGDRVESSKIYVVENIPPSSPLFKPFPTNVVIGESFDIEWNESTDVDGVIYGYILEKCVNRSDRWEPIYQGSDLATQDVIYEGSSVVQYRIFAYDDKFAYSEPTYSEYIYTISNVPPTISPNKNVNLGVVKKVNITYTVSDPGDTVNVVEYFDNTIIKTYKNVEGISHTISFSESQISKEEDGIHTIRVSATDSFGAVTNRTWVFKKGGGAQSDTRVNRYRVFRKMEDGSYKAVRFENDSNNILRLDDNVSVEESLDNYLPELRQTNDQPDDVNKGKIVVGYSKLFAKGANGKLIVLTPYKPPYVAGTTAPSDKTVFWIDTRDSKNPLLRYHNGKSWVLLKSIYSGGMRDN